MLNVLVTGGRDFDDLLLVHTSLYEIAITTGKSIRVVHGNAKGADWLARSWCRVVGFESVAYEANWNRYGKSAGVKRNQEMLDKEPIDVVLAFPGGVGTADMVKRAKTAGIEVIFAVDIGEESF